MKGAWLFFPAITIASIGCKEQGKLACLNCWELQEMGRGAGTDFSVEPGTVVWLSSGRLIQTRKCHPLLLHPDSKLFPYFLNLIAMSALPVVCVRACHSFWNSIANYHKLLKQRMLIGFNSCCQLRFLPTCVPSCFCV